MEASCFECETKRIAISFLFETGSCVLACVSCMLLIDISLEKLGKHRPPNLFTNNEPLTLGLEESSNQRAMATSLYGTRIPRTPVLEALRACLTEARLERIESRLLMRSSRLQLCAENFGDPHNMAAIVRTFEALGGQHFHVLDPHDRWHGSSVSRSSEQWLTTRFWDSPAQFSAAMKCEGYTVASTSLGPASTGIDDLDFSSAFADGNGNGVAVVLGNEGGGVSNEMMAASDLIINVPMVGFSQSLNVSVTAALIISTCRTAGLLGVEGSGNLSDSEMAELYERWCLLSVSKGEDMLLRQGLTPDFCHADHFARLETSKRRRNNNRSDT